MPRNEHLVLCGAAAATPRRGGKTVRLNLHEPSPNVRLQITDISRPLVANIPDVLVDLLDIASYVYAADSAIPRGGPIGAHMGKRWRRSFRFAIPVRLPEHWSSGPVTTALVETLSFLSEDNYELEFQRLSDPHAREGYFRFPDGDDTGFSPDEVALFSGGLDSLGGAVEELARGRRVALVSHRSASKIAGAQKRLVSRLRDRFGAGRLLHIPVWTHLDEELGREATHRTRSFLFAALAAVIARLFDKDRILFFENGVVSLNLPPVGQVVGARATRSTHPQVLTGLRRVLSAVLDRDFAVDNPFAWRTKAEVVGRIAESACGELIRDTRSCTRIRDMTRLHPHCGRCSQCIDRRFAVLAAAQGHEDPAESYGLDLFVGERPAGPDREMALAYVRSASRIRLMADVAFFEQRGEASRIVGHLAGEPADRVAGRILDLHRRHSLGVCAVFDDAISAHASALREGSLPADCLLSLVVGRPGAMSAYPPPIREAEAVAANDAEIRLAVDEDGKRVVFDRWGGITGVSAELLIALAEPFREATRSELAPERFPFTPNTKLLRQTHCKNHETLRRRVLRCRRAIAEMAKRAGDPPPSMDSVIENIQWRGYRLNPDRVRIVAISELSRSDQVTLLPHDVTPLHHDPHESKG